MLWCVQMGQYWVARHTGRVVNSQATPVSQAKYEKEDPRRSEEEGEQAEEGSETDESCCYCEQEAGHVGEEFQQGSFSILGSLVCLGWHP